MYVKLRYLFDPWRVFWQPFDMHEPALRSHCAEAVVVLLTLGHLHLLRRRHLTHWLMRQVHRAPVEAGHGLHLGWHLGWVVWLARVLLIVDLTLLMHDFLNGVKNSELQHEFGLLERVVADLSLFVAETSLWNKATHGLHRLLLIIRRDGSENATYEFKVEL